MHALSAPAKSLKRVQLFFRVSSFAQRPAQQAMPTMSPVMVQALVDVSAASNQGPDKLKPAWFCRSHALRLGTSLESLFIN